MLASPYHQITTSNSVRGIILWALMCIAVFYVINGLATRPMGVEVENYRKPGMTDEQVLSIALQKAYSSRKNNWWINERESYLVFDTVRQYQISQAMYEAFDLTLTENAASQPIAVFNPKMAGMRAP